MSMNPRRLHLFIVAAAATATVSLGAVSAVAAGPEYPPRSATAKVPHSAPVAASYSAAKGSAAVKTVGLAAKGHTAKVYKVGKNSYRADVLFQGKKVGSLSSAKGRTATANLNGLHIKLTPTGAVSSWADRAKPHQPTASAPDGNAEPGPDDRSTPVPDADSNPATQPGGHTADTADTGDQAVSGSEELLAAAV
ncbi:hypothetical protein [Streptomyces luteolus]|uniref:Uncharacterized protein n=1 Tax=Streptomyces luteolus TaxID=3043615 RepID=A0ABT6SWJ5_9ACTN|nr:hypothetical protein [Streptomyces sp. B-S-A12]MDI3419973.1 hypothetical protein [Streptomyces sp. B-S-A12]